MVDRSTLALLALVVAPGLLLAACVSKGRFDAAVHDAETTHAALTQALDRDKAAESEISKLRDELTDAQAQVQTRDQTVSDLSTSDHNLQARLDESTAINSKLRAELR